MTEAQIDQQLKDFKAGGMGGVFIHPRPGLITEYLSDEWFSLCKYTVEKGKALGMDVWLYDENSYPSGFAGGHVPAQMPESYNQGQGLILQKVEKLPENANTFFLILKQKDSIFTDITDKLDQEKNKNGDYYLYKKSYHKNSPWNGGYSYVDLLYEGVTEKFLEVTMTGYEKAIGSEFGKTVPGIFTDEPNISASGDLRWTPSLFKDFKDRWGYDLKTNLPSLTFETGDWKRVRHNYFTTLLELFIERWSKPYYNYTEKNNLNWTGHYWEHGWPNPVHGGDNMAMYAWHQIPAIDILMNQYSEHVNAQFGNVRAVKELSSVVNQMDKTRALSETYGAGGWDLRFEDMKRIGDWQYVLGVNFLNQHLSYITLEGARKRDHPQSFSYHEPWWKNYKVQGDYFARLSLALTSGKQVNNILVIEPTSTAWMYFSARTSNNKFSELGPKFQKFVFDLEQNQIEYDLASENIVKDIGLIKGKYFVVGKRPYNIVIIPPTLENLDKTTFELIKTYLKNGGKVISFNKIPGYVDGSSNDDLKTIVAKYSEQWIEANSLSEQQTYNALVSKSIQFQEPEMIRGKLFHHRRDLKDGQVVFLVNTSLNEWSGGTFTIKGKSIKELDLINGEVKAYQSKVEGDRVKVNFDLPPSGSLLLSISDETSKDTDKLRGKANIISASGKLQIRKTDLNVLTLDYCDLNLDGKIEKDIYYFQAADKIFKHYGFDGNPWSSAVQYKTNIVDRNNFAGKPGFEVSYSFSVDKDLDTKSMQVVIERPDLWEVSVNSKKVSRDPSKYWLDRKFGVYNIGNNVKAGENLLRLVAPVMTIYSEVEAVYLLGDFGLKSQKKGWKLIPPKSLELGSWKDQGYPFYSKNVAYTKTYNLKSKVENKRYIIKLFDWYGSVTEVMVNNKSAGIIAWSPNELDITDQIKEGDNEISIVISGTLKNLLGPHHIGPVHGTAWPVSFASANKNLPSGNKYDLINYGLFQDFKLIESVGPPQKVYWKMKQVETLVFDSIDSISMNKPISVSISTNTQDAEIRYTLDGTTPNRSSLLYSEPLLLKKNAVLTATSFKDELMASEVLQRHYYIIKKKKNDRKNRKYTKGIEYHYYEGMWSKVPDFTFLSEIRKGYISDFKLDKIERRVANFSVEFVGFIKIEREDDYTFYTSSNDGSKLLINDILIVDNDGVHGDTERNGRIHLKPGLHPIKVQYFDAGGSQSLRVQIEGTNLSRQVIPEIMLFY